MCSCVHGTVLYFIVANKRNNCIYNNILQHICLKNNIPMLLKRKETKSYGTKKLFEGSYKIGDKIAIVDDVLMTGGTLIKDLPVCMQCLNLYNTEMPLLKHLRTLYMNIFILHAGMFSMKTSIYRIIELPVS